MVRELWSCPMPHQESRLACLGVGFTKARNVERRRMRNHEKSNLRHRSPVWAFRRMVVLKARLKKYLGVLEMLP
jgi:hypothetical protein